MPPGLNDAFDVAAFAEASTALTNDNDAVLAERVRREGDFALQLGAVPEAYKKALGRLVFELAMGMEDEAETFKRHGYSEDEAAALKSNAKFVALLDETRTAVIDKGLSFTAKARAMAEDLLPDAYAMAKDVMTAAATRHGIIQWITRMGKLEPAKEVAAETPTGTGGAGFVLNITLAGGAPQQVVATQTAVRVPIDSGEGRE